MSRRILTAREQHEMLSPWREAAVNQDLVDRLHNEFHDWWDNTDQISDLERRYSGGGDRGPIGYWPHIEKFMKNQYPAAHRALGVGLEAVGPLLDHPERFVNRPHRPGEPDFTPYDTGPDAVVKHGYDPKEIAAGMLLLHNRTMRDSDVQQMDVDRLNDIAQKRYQMQRAYEQRNARTAMPAPKISIGPHRDPEFNMGEAAQAWDGDKLVGYLSWYGRNTLKPGRQPEVGYVAVHPDYRRQGIARSLIEWARKNREPELQFNDWLSVSGKALAESMGYTPRNWSPEEADTSDQDDSEWEPGGRFYHSSIHLSMPNELDVYDDWYDEEGHDPADRPEPHAGPWYHYSPTKLPVGTHLTPGHDSPWGDDLYGKDGSEHRRNYVWLSPSVTEAAGWAELSPRRGDSGRGHLYRVEPSGDVLPWNGTGSDGWVADSAHIMEELSYPWKEPHTAARLAMTRRKPVYFALNPERPGHAMAYWGDRYEPIAEVKWQTKGLPGYSKDWAPSPEEQGSVDWVWSHPHARHKGITRRLLEWVRDNHEPNLHGSNNMTPAGRALSEALGQTVDDSKWNRLQPVRGYERPNNDAPYRMVDEGRDEWESQGKPGGYV